MKKAQENLIKDCIEEKLREQFTKGLLDGSKAICYVVLEKINKSDNDKTLISDIKDFCEKSLGIPGVK